MARTASGRLGFGSGCFEIQRSNDASCSRC